MLLELFRANELTTFAGDGCILKPDKLKFEQTNRKHTEALLKKIGFEAVMP